MTGGVRDLQPWRTAGRIAAKARQLGLSLAVPGRTRRELADKIERYIRDQGAQPAFPANLSRNDEAAHFTPAPEDSDRLTAGDLLKVDVGAHIDGAIADTAATIEVGGSHRHDRLVAAAREALTAGISRVHAGAEVNELSLAIEGAITRLGLKPVRDLTGHSIEPYLLHAGKSIPNVAGMSRERLEEGEIIAIEPFATNGLGSIENGRFGNIVRFRGDPGPADASLHAMFAKFRTLPFTARWLEAPPDRERLAKVRKRLQAYPVFVERGRGLVSQAEHTVLVTSDGAEVLTADGP